MVEVAEAEEGIGVTGLRGPLVVPRGPGAVRLDAGGAAMV